MSTDPIAAGVIETGGMGAGIAGAHLALVAGKGVEVSG